MKKSRYSVEEIVLNFRKIEIALQKCRTLQDACREFGIVEQSYYRWKEEYGTKKRLWLNSMSCIRLRAEHENHIWTYDFVQDNLENGTKFRILNIMDEYTRKRMMESLQLK